MNDQSVGGFRRQVLQRAGLAMLALGLTSCAVNEVHHAPAYKLDREKATVIISVTQDSDIGAAIFYMDQSAEGNYFLQKQQLLYSIRDVFGVQQRSDFSDVRGSLYVLEVTPGRHEVEHWVVRSGNLVVKPRAPLPRLVFEVRAGETVYLGNLHVRMLSGDVGILNQRRVIDAQSEVRDRHVVDLQVAESKVRGVTADAVVRLLPLGPWLSGTSLGIRPPPVFLPPPPVKR